MCYLWLSCLLRSPLISSGPPTFFVFSDKNIFKGSRPLLQEAFQYGFVLSFPNILDEGQIFLPSYEECHVGT